MAYRLFKRRVRSTSRENTLLCGFLALIVGFGGGCASSKGPEVLTIQPSQYDLAFDAAIEVARKAGMPANLKDRRGGVIETQPCVAGSLLEPWRTDNASFKQAAGNTLAYLRRYMRFEFSSTEFRPPTGTESKPLTGPDVVGAEAAAEDLTHAAGVLELRVSVFVELANVPGVRRSSWTRSQTTTAKLVVPEGDSGLVSGTSWTPVTRDVAYERRMLAEIEKVLQTSQ